MSIDIWAGAEKMWERFHYQYEEDAPGFTAKHYYIFKPPESSC